MIEQLQHRLDAYDGRSITILGEIEAALSQKPRYLDALIALSGSIVQHTSAGATWLIKSALESGAALKAEQMDEFCAMLPKVTDWAACLHICQSIQYLEIPADRRASVWDWLIPLSEHERPFVRAWALDALSWIAGTERARLLEWERMLESGLHDEAASVRARARQIARRIC